MVKFVKDYTQEEIDDGNDIPLFCVSWDAPSAKRPDRKSGNGYTSKAKANRVYTDKLRMGKNPQAKERRIAGFV